MFYQRNSDGYIMPLEGIKLKTLTYGEKMSMTEFVLEGGRELPVHDHPNEQIGFLVSGRMDLRVGDEVFHVYPGDSWCIPSGVSHGATILEDSVAIEVFAPIREDYLSGAAD